ncbi:TIGR03618 family F420-dependent PPOX class oxidoreductase [Streptomyces boncukensis]|uniref:TIGR03618 family F420-dependent PPOX class oxidoreductase n=1 Tax=Streptomyces boncukensis TaxID=2711219 RepID=A0A6G4X3B3_9ACTN|nr:TIGR03618 family F420-dependent PPOX class oxidoreductase [Streptomyces boncukensis]NGO71622.1 TIGR03618 family F420-dependent PPOX class oxidoreductase [Streptomyces boncukensis]
MSEAPLLVVGAGPVGLTVAHELTRRGVRVRLVDRAPGPATSSRALAVHARTLEICDQMGLLDELLPRGRRVEHFTLHRRGRTLIRFDTDYSTMPTRYPFSLMVDQVVTEQVLRERLAQLGVAVEWGLGLDSFTPGADAVEVRLTGADGHEERYAVPWLVGADGAHSTVRKRLGLRLLGDATETWLNADVETDAELPADSNHLLHTSGGTLLLVPFPERGKWRVVDTLDTGNADDPEAVRERLARKMSDALGRPVKVSAPSWLSVFTVQQRMIDSMRSGRCFVAGDAAHVHSPASGQGMNAGIQDGYNLAWKLADVVRGFAGERLLDSYGAERVPIGERLLSSTRVATALVALRNALGPVLLPLGLGAVRGIAPLKRKLERKMIRGFCGLTVEYPGSPLSLPSASGGAPGPGPGPGQRVGCTARAHRDHAGWRELCRELRDPRWTLLVPVDGDREAAGALLDTARVHGPAVSCRALCDTAAPAEPAGAGADSRPRVLPDPDGALRRDLGLGAGDFALIRPDGYLAARGPLAGGRGPDRALGALGLTGIGAPGDSGAAPCDAPARGAAPARKNHEKRSEAMSKVQEQEDAYRELLARHSGGRGVLVTLKRDGRPQLSNVGYSYDRATDTLRVATTEDRAKTRNARRDPRVGFHVTTGDMFAYGVFEGTASVSEVAADPHDAVVDELVEMYRATQGEHPDWEEFRETKVKDRRLVLRVHVERCYGFILRQD